MSARHYGPIVGTLIAAHARQRAGMCVTSALAACAFTLVAILPGGALGTLYWPAALVWTLALAAVSTFPWSRFVFSLPVERRQLARAAWLSAVFGPVFIVLIGKIITNWIVSSMHVDRGGLNWILLSTVFDVACAGTTVFILAAAPAGTNRDWISGLCWALALLSVPIVAVLSAPLSTSHLSLAGWMFPVAGLVLSALSWRRSDRLAIAGALRGLPMSARAHGARETASAPPAMPAVSSWRLLPIANVIARQIMFASLLCLALLVAGVIGDALVDGATLSSSMSDLRRVLATDIDSVSPFHLTMMLPILMLSRRAPAWNPRWMRVLPLAGWEINALVHVRGVAFGVAFLLATGVVGLVLGATLTWLQPASALFIVGAGCLASAATFGERPQQGWLPAPAIGVWIGLAVASRAVAAAGEPAHSARLLALGAACLVVSIVWVYWRVTLSRRTYRPVTSPFDLRLRDS